MKGGDEASLLATYFGGGSNSSQKLMIKLLTKFQSLCSTFILFIYFFGLLGLFLTLLSQPRNRLGLARVRKKKKLYFIFIDNPVIFNQLKMPFFLCVSNCQLSSIASTVNFFKPGPTKGKFRRVKVETILFLFFVVNVSIELLLFFNNMFFDKIITNLGGKVPY